MLEVILDLGTLMKVVEYKAKGLEVMVEQMEVLENEKVVTIKGQQQVKTIAKLHLEKVVKLECSLQEKKGKNENLNHLLGWASEMSTILEQKQQEVVLLQAQIDKLMVDNNNLQGVVDVQIEESLHKSYKIGILEEHMKIEKVDKEKLLDRLSELNDEAFTLRHQQDIQGVEQDNKEDVLQQ